MNKYISAKKSFYRKPVFVHERYFRNTATAVFCTVVASGAFAVESEVQLKTVDVKANTVETADGPVNGYRAKKGATGTKTDVPLMLTPVSVQVVSREVMDDQQVLTIADAIKNVSGVYTRQGPDGNTMDAFNIRGFQVASYGSTYLDGVKDFSRAPKETAGLERVEVLKGPAAIMYGRIEPGGMINRVSKKPQVDQLTKIQQQFGTDNFLRTTLDSTGSLTGSSDWLYRVNIAVEDSDGFKDRTNNNRIYAAPQIEWRPSESTFIRTGVEYTKNDRSWAQTYGTIGDVNGPVKIPISRNLHGDGESYNDESWLWHLTWAHQFNDQWALQQRVTYVDRSSVARGSWLGAADLAGNYEREYWGWDDEKAKVASTNIDVTGKLDTGPLQHTVLIGVDYYWEDYDSGGWAGGGTPVLSNIHNPDTSAPYMLDYTTDTYWYKNTNQGVYLQDQIALFEERLQILIGARYDDADYETAYATTVNKATDEALTWRGGVLYQIVPNVSVYASYVEGFGASNTSSTQKFDPQTSNQIEVGTKVELSPDIGFTIAVFELVKDNLTMADPLDDKRTILAGEATSKGVEFDLTGQITPNWNAIFNYAYTDVRFTRSDRFQDNHLHSVPRHGASLWTTYRVGGTGLQIGGGVTYRSDRIGVQRGTPPSPLYPYTLDEYTLFDAMIAYDFNVSNLPVRAQLNVNNATDETYFPSGYGSQTRIAQGTPRMVLGSISVSF